MGCIVSTPIDGGGNRRMPGNIGEVAVFVPGLRIPKSVDFSFPLAYSVSKSLVERLSVLRTRIVVMASQEAPKATRPRRRTATQHGSQLDNKIEFVWFNQEDEAEETAIWSAWYEVLSVLHLMAMLCLSEANFLLLPKTTSDGYQPKVSEENRRNSVDIFLKAAGYLECAVQQILPCIPPAVRSNLPVDLEGGVLRALCLQALGQGVDIQLGLAIDSAKATLAVKRRLACEMVKYWHQAQDSIMQVSLNSGWGQKHRLFVKWKYSEAKAAAYYYHGLILDEGNTEQSHGMAVAALQAAEEFLKERKKASEAFNSEPPISRSPPLWGTMKYLSEKIPKDTSSKLRINRDLYSHDRIIETAPVLPDFALALKP
ncbi:hypothetical protein QJS10_CPA01g00041 [Acorus calamus]|uniref:BRO1 domain-containing protein n=1 Tax=Acorus calamus TaxID=4465 RepID=A0AAV9FKT5_ACOCL|nr:hypothetical protein QJS10_CPA01g00041 [Acorus calamus]